MNKLYNQIMREIEIKVHIDDKQKTLDALKNLGVELGLESKHHDVVWGQKVNGKFIHGSNWLRVRTVNDKTTYLTLKRSVTGQMDSIEHKTTVGDGAVMARIIEDLGYEPYSNIVKTRQVGHHGKIEICLDELPKLGTFLEVELLSPENSDYNKVAAELWALLGQLGIGKSAEETDGYDVLVNKLEGRNV